jgi:hypothetical protein
MFDLGLELLQLSLFSNGIEALRKPRRVFCGRGSSFVRSTPPVVPLAKGDKPLAFIQRSNLFTVFHAALRRHDR